MMYNRGGGSEISVPQTRSASSWIFYKCYAQVYECYCVLHVLGFNYFMSVRRR